MTVIHLLNGKDYAFMFGALCGFPFRLFASVYLTLSDSFVEQSTAEASDIPRVELGERKSLGLLTDIDSPWLLRHSLACPRLSLVPERRIVEGGCKCLLVPLLNG
jgi:hypothetical protein